MASMPTTDGALARGAGAQEADGTGALLRLLTWLSPSFPVGAFAFSHGLESAIDARQITDADTLYDWVRTLLEHGSGWNDLVLFAEAHAAAGDPARLQDVADLAVALGGTRERRLETLALGAAFIAASAPWCEDAGDLPDAPYPVAVGRLAAAEGVPLEPALTAYAHAFAATLVTAATRLVPLGQGDMVRVTKRLEPVILDAANRAADSTLDDLGSAAILSEIAAMRHETMETRLFRS
jgi:urease accessory protein